VVLGINPNWSMLNVGSSLPRCLDRTCSVVVDVDRAIRDACQNPGFLHEDNKVNKTYVRLGNSWVPGIPTVLQSPFSRYSILFLVHLIHAGLLPALWEKVPRHSLGSKSHEPAHFILSNLL
jgi:hypothetical protein